MQKRNPIAVALLPFITFGIYFLYWSVKTKGEMKALGADIPTAWLIIIPLVNIWWLWKYCQGVQHVTDNKLNGVLAFVLIWLLGSIGGAIVQDSFNNNLSASTAPVASAETTPAETDEPASPAEETTPPSDSDQPPAAPVVQ